MYTVILTTGLFVIIGILVGLNEDKNKIIYCVGASLLLGFIGAMIGFIIALSLPTPQKNIQSSVYNLESMKDHSSVSGTFFLGSGTIDGDFNYVFYYKKNGFIEVKNISHRLAKVRYTKEAPRVIKIERLPGWSIDNDFNLQKYILEIPEGSIKNNFILDAE